MLVFVRSHDSLVISSSSLEIFLLNTENLASPYHSEDTFSQRFLFVAWPSLLLLLLDRGHQVFDEMLQPWSLSTQAPFHLLLL